MMTFCGAGPEANLFVTSSRPIIDQQHYTGQMKQRTGGVVRAGVEQQIIITHFEINRQFISIG